MAMLSWLFFLLVLSSKHATGGNFEKVHWALGKSLKSSKIPDGSCSPAIRRQNLSPKSLLKATFARRFTSFLFVYLSTRSLVVSWPSLLGRVRERRRKVCKTQINRFKLAKYFLLLHLVARHTTREKSRRAMKWATNEGKKNSCTLTLVNLQTRKHKKEVIYFISKALFSAERIGSGKK